MKRQNRMPLVLVVALGLAPISRALAGQAASTFSYEGRAYQTDGATPLTASNAVFTLSIIGSNSLSCVVYEETQSENLSATDGYFSLTVGSGTVTSSDSGHTLTQVFDTSGTISGKNSVTGSACSIGATESRRLLVKLYDGSVTVALDPPVAIGSSPYATVAHTLSGKSSSDFVQVTGSVTQTSLNDLAALHDALTALANGTSSLYVRPGDVTASIGGKTVDTSISSLSSVPGDNGKVLTWDSTNQKWSAQSPATSLTPSSTFAGDVSGTSSAMNVDKLKGVTLGFSSLSSGDVLKYNGAAWVNGTLGMSNVSGLVTALASKIDATQMPGSCSSGQTLTFSSPIGTWLCTTITVSAASFGTQTKGTVLAAPQSADGAPTFRTIASTDLPSTIGPSASSALTLQTGGAARQTIDASGNVGIGTASPSAKLDIAGQARTQAYDASSSGTTIDWNNGNIQYTTAGCATFSFSNMLDGAAYTLIIKNPSGTCAFTDSGLTMNYVGGVTSITINAKTAFSFIRAGSDVFVTWVSF